MNVKGIATKFAKGDIQYVLGRFKTVRVVYSGVRRLMAKPVLEPDGRLTLFEQAGQDSRHVFSHNNIQRRADRYLRADCGVIELGWRRALRQRCSGFSLMRSRRLLLRRGTC
jgi:hypothetical protein